MKGRCRHLDSCLLIQGSPPFPALRSFYLTGCELT